MIVIGGAMTRRARERAGTDQAPVLAPLAVLVCSALLVLSQLYLAIPLAPVIAEVLGRGGSFSRIVWRIASGTFVAATGKWRNPFVLPPKSLTFLVLSAFATGASWVCYFRALKVGEAAKVAPVDKLSVVLVAVFAVAFLGERPAPREWLGIGLVALGVLVLSLRR